MGKINDLISAWMSEIEGYELSRSEFVKEGSARYLRVYVDKLEDGQYISMGSDDCEKLSRYLSAKLDEADPIEQNYYLEVSSPGLDRQLVSEKDFIRFAGSLVDVRLYTAFEGSKQISARLIGLADGRLELETDKGKIALDMESVAKINLAVIF